MASESKSRAEERALRAFLTRQPMPDSTPEEREASRALTLWDLRLRLQRMQERQGAH